MENRHIWLADLIESLKKINSSILVSFNDRKTSSKCTKPLNTSVIYFIFIFFCCEIVNKSAIFRKASKEFWRYTFSKTKKLYLLHKMICHSILFFSESVLGGKTRCFNPRKPHQLAAATARSNWWFTRWTTGSINYQNNSSNNNNFQHINTINTIPVITYNNRSNI